MVLLCEIAVSSSGEDIYNLLFIFLLYRPPLLPLLGNRNLDVL